MRVKIVMMQKDESLLLEPWLKYHGYLFGFENLTVLDNGSSNETVIFILKKYERLGVYVERQFNTGRDFDAKGELAADIIRSWDKTKNYDFAIPLDCDEFVGLWQDGQISCARDAIHEYLRAIKSFRGAYGVETSLFNIPGSPGWYWPQDGTKTFFGAGTIKALDHGFHFGKTILGNEVFQTQLTYFHFHYKPFRDYIQSALNKLRPYVDVSNKAALQSYTGPGGHLLATVLGVEADYVRRFDSCLRIHLPALGYLLDGLGVQAELFNSYAAVAPYPELAVATEKQCDDRPANYELFDASLYRKTWLDVATEGFDPLLHYIRIGRFEGRAISTIASERDN